MKQQYQQQNKEQQSKRSPIKQQPNDSKPRKVRKKIDQNPFEQLLYLEDAPKQIKEQNQWIKVKTTPLTIQITDHTKVNKFHSHKSIQKYIRYLYAQSCPNPMWLSIKRQSQIKKIIYIDIEGQSTILHRNLEKDYDESCLQFVRQFVCPERKAIFREAPFQINAKQVWESMFVYDELAIKQDIHVLVAGEKDEVNEKAKILPQHLTPQLLAKYRTHLLNIEQRSFNLYPMRNLPAYKEYYRIKSEEAQDTKQDQVQQQAEEKQGYLDNRILIVDCEMVMSAYGFELARASIMNFNGELIYDQFFKPEAQITNYNTQYSGITSEILQNVTKTIKDLHTDIKTIIKPHTILVGHSLENDLHAMKLFHENIIDTSVLFARRNGIKMKLKTLSYQILGRTIQQGSHCSSEDCRATLQLLRYKVQLRDARKDGQRDSKYHLLKQLNGNGKNILLLDSDLQYMQHQTQYTGVSFCVTPSNDPMTILKPLQHYFKSNSEQQQQLKLNMDIGFTRIRKSVDEQWEQYYRKVDGGLRELYNQIPTNTVIFLNWQINHSYVVYPISQSKESQQERKRAFCIIIVKSVE